MGCVYLSELRQDLLTGEWVIFAANRKDRPYDFVKKSIPKQSPDCKCQFCPENEDLTPESVYQDDIDGKWNIRVFPNMFPALSREDYSVNRDSFYCGKEGIGLHEVLVDTPEHMGKLQDFSKDHITEILSVLQKRYNKMRQTDGILYVQIFKNNGPEAGASIVHSHWQMIGIGVIPKEQTDMISSCKQYYEEKKRCLYCDILKHELEEKIRVIEENAYFVAFAPYASKFCYEISIAPKMHISHYSELDGIHLQKLSEILKNMLYRVKKVNTDICYNICFEDSPFAEETEPYSHWFLRIVPRMGNFAGFEFATRSYINSILPEDAAAFYRDIALEEETRR